MILILSRNQILIIINDTFFHINLIFRYSKFAKKYQRTKFNQKYIFFNLLIKSIDQQGYENLITRGKLIENQICGF
ncbi:hypothetical protein pb186bvf_017411 [Paramecium bursaria]